MAIALVCSCGKSLNVKDELAGKRIKCPACFEVLEVPLRNARHDDAPDEYQEEEDVPVRRRSGQRAVQKKSNALLYVLLGVGFALFSCCGVGVLGVIVLAAMDSQPVGRPGAFPPPPVMQQAPAPVIKMATAVDKDLGSPPVEEKFALTEQDVVLNSPMNNAIEKHRYKAFTIQLTFGVNYVFEMTPAPGTRSEPCLLLQMMNGITMLPSGPTDRKIRDIIKAQNPAADGPQVARIVFIGQNGQFRIIATTFDNEPGDFTLVVKESGKIGKGIGKGKGN